MGVPSGLSEEPGQVSSLGSRLICGKCGAEPRIKNPEKLTRGDVMIITVECHGEQETKSIKWKDLVFTQTFFEGQSSDA